MIIYQVEKTIRIQILLKLKMMKEFQFGKNFEVYAKIKQKRFLIIV